MQSATVTVVEAANGRHIAVEADTIFEKLS